MEGSRSGNAPRRLRARRSERPRHLVGGAPDRAVTEDALHLPFNSVFPENTVLEREK